MEQNKKRLELQSILENLLGSKNVYYQPPENLKMEYPAIRYSKDNINNFYADDMKYNNRDSYNLTIISRYPDHPVIKEILKMNYTSFKGHYVSNNLHHDTIKIFY